MNKKRIPEYLTQHFSDEICEISYQCSENTDNTKPFVVILHALTGNSTVSGKNGWWKEIVGKNKTIDCSKYNVLSIDTLGNGFATDTHLHIHSVENITVNDVAKINLWLLEELKLTVIHSLIGGSLGGAIAWEMWKEKPDYFQKLISIGAYPLEDSWIRGVTFLQKKLLRENESGYEQARMWSMLFYRNALGINSKFNQNSQSIENWLTYHGSSLKERFSQKSYELMNHLLGAIGKGSNKEQFLNVAKKSPTQIVIISISSDWLFHQQHQTEWTEEIKQVHENITHHSLESIHGHDAFLIEFEKLGKILENYL